MSKLGVPYVPCSLVWTKISLDKHSSVYPTCLPKKFVHFGTKVCLTGEFFKSRLSLGMASNKTYHFQTTANHYRFIKVWTSIADLPTSNFLVQTFFGGKVWLRNAQPTYDLDICPNFRSFFFL